MWQGPSSSARTRETPTPSCRNFALSKPPLLSGSGQPAMPWERMHRASASAAATLPFKVVRVPPPATCGDPPPPHPAASSTSTATATTDGTSRRRQHMTSRLLSVESRERDVDRKPAAGSGAGGHARGVRFGDRLDDGEAEPDPVAEAARARAESLERQEDARDVVVRNRRTGVDDREDRTIRLGPACDLDPAAGDVVADRIRDEVVRESLEQVGVAVRPGRRELRHAVEPDRVVRLERSGRDGGEV